MAHSHTSRVILFQYLPRAKNSLKFFFFKRTFEFRNVIGLQLNGVVHGPLRFYFHYTFCFILFRFISLLLYSVFPQVYILLYGRRLSHRCGVLRCIIYTRVQISFHFLFFVFVFFFSFLFVACGVVYADDHYLPLTVSCWASLLEETKVKCRHHLAAGRGSTL